MGDIACPPGEPATEKECRQEDTAALTESLDPDTVLVLGDLQYPGGSAEDFAASYDRSWGRLRSRTRPAVGNHEYGTPAAAGYFGYWGDVAAPPHGWYSFDVPDVGWHVVVLNSTRPADPAQLEWLGADLAASAATCTLAAFHHPRHSSGPHGGDPALQPLVDALVADCAELALAGHDHLYERFAPVDGVTHVVAGTGGRSHYVAEPQRRAAGSEVVVDDRFGVLELRLAPGRWSWRFVAVGGDVLDEGQASCH